jgi:hypothetical protein
MQKTAFGRLIREELTRALVFGVGFFAILASGFASVAYAANGWIYSTRYSRPETGNRQVMELSKTPTNSGMFQRRAMSSSRHDKVVELVNVLHDFRQMER